MSLRGLFAPDCRSFGFAAVAGPRAGFSKPADHHPRRIAAGGVSDVMARLYAETVSPPPPPPKKIGQNIVVEN